MMETKKDLTVERFLFNLNTLGELGEEICSPKDFNSVIKSALYMVMGSFFASKGIIFKYDPVQKIFFPVVSKGIDNVAGITLRLSDKAIGAFVGYNKPLDLKGSSPMLSYFSPVRTEFAKFGARIMVFLIVGNELIGALSINDKFSGEGYTDYDFQLLSIMSQHLSYSLHNHSLLVKLMHKYTENKELYENLRQAYYNTIHSFATAIDAKDSYTKGHSHRVSAYCSALAQEMGWDEEDIEGIRVAGLLHDIGKLAVDKTIINKSSPLTKFELGELYSHPVVGYEILSKIKFPWESIPMMTRNHHEKVDGNGYPDKLKKSEIPIGARMMSLVDAFDAMTTNRPYRSRRSFAEAINELKNHCNEQFDTDIAYTFITAVRKEVLELNSPSIILHLHELLDITAIDKLLEHFPKT
ncbi:MAG: HD domain-containing phosphohydrolase [Planctomycetota bacterium]